MATKLADEPMVQMATRIPASLLMKVRVHCVEQERSIMEFVADAVREKLRRAGSRSI
jgi:hypothetical protein